MPWRARFISSRRHPLALGCYSMSALLGACFLLGLFQSQAAEHVATSGWQLAWEWELCLGGVVGLVGAVWPAGRRLDDALNAEALGSMIACFGFLSWAWSASIESHWTSPASVVFGVVAVSFGARSGQAIHDRRKWVTLTKQIARESR